MFEEELRVFNDLRDVESDIIRTLWNIVELSGKDKLEKGRILYLVASDRVTKNIPEHVWPSCHLFISGLNLVLFLVHVNGSRVVDGLLAGPYLSDIQDVVEKAREYGCVEIVRKLELLKKYWST